MNKHPGPVKRMVIVLSSVAVLLLCGLCGLTVGYQYMLAQARLHHSPPTVYITEPLPGTTVAAGSHVLISATASGDTPITRVELWLDGLLVDTEEVEEPEAASAFYAHFGVLAQEGPQQIFVRAVNSAGLVGQSEPIGVWGEDVAEETLEAVLVEPGQTITDIAIARDVEPETLRDLNPDVGQGDLQVGSVITVPARLEEAPPASVGPSVSPSASGTPPVGPSTPGGGAVTMPDGPPLQVIPPATIPSTSWVPTLAIAHLEPPVAPDGLQGVVDNCMVRLRWNDNADDETRYEVWMAPQSGSRWLIAKLSPAAGGAAWYEFPAPLTGGLSFWVEAVGSFGSQPSNIVWLEIEPRCPTNSSTRLEVEALDMSVRGGYDRVYCYLSLEETPEGRIPADDSSFIRVQHGQGDISTWASGSKKFVVPIPSDGVFKVQGECWGWSGDALDKLGTFSDGSVSSQWDGTRLALAGSGFEIGYAVTLVGGDSGAGQETTYGYEDPTLPAPYDLDLLTRTIPGIPGSSTTTLYWHWTGDQSKITGFTVYLNGSPFKTLSGGDTRGMEVKLVTFCGKTYRWQVVALAGDAQSPLSAPYDFHSWACPVMVEVQFKELDISCAENYYIHYTCPNCGDVGAWWTLYANDKQRKSYYSNWRFVLTCGVYPIAQIDEHKGDTLMVAIQESDPTLKVGSWFYYMGRWGEPRKFQYASRTITMPLDRWLTFDQEFDLASGGDGVYSKLRVRVRGPNTGGSIL